MREAAMQMAWQQIHGDTSMATWLTESLKSPAEILTMLH
jgi:hypothetical protein